jgi:hypothetical protein
VAHRDDDLETLACLLVSAVTAARTLKLNTAGYILSMALMEVVEVCDAERLDRQAPDPD